MKRAILVGAFAMATACAPQPTATGGKTLTVAAKADRSYGNCRVSVGERAYRLNDDLSALRNDMRARYGARMHLWSTEVRLQALNFDAGDCGASALAGLHRAGFVKFTLLPADQRVGAVAPIPPAPTSQP